MVNTTVILTCLFSQQAVQSSAAQQPDLIKLLINHKAKYSLYSADIHSFRSHGKTVPVNNGKNGTQTIFVVNQNNYYTKTTYREPARGSQKEDRIMIAECAFVDNILLSRHALNDSLAKPIGVILTNQPELSKILQHTPMTSRYFDLHYGAGHSTLLDIAKMYKYIYSSIQDGNNIIHVYTIQHNFNSYELRFSSYGQLLGCKTVVKNYVETLSESWKGQVKKNFGDIHSVTTNCVVTKFTHNGLGSVPATIQFQRVFECSKKGTVVLTEVSNYTHFDEALKRSQNIKEMMTTIPNNTPVTVEGEEHIEHVWFNGEAVRKVDLTTFAKLRKNIFVNGPIAYSLIATCILLIITMFFWFIHMKRSIKLKTL